MKKSIKSNKSQKLRFLKYSLLASISAISIVVMPFEGKAVDTITLSPKAQTHLDKILTYCFPGYTFDNLKTAQLRVLEKKLANYQQANEVRNELKKAINDAKKKSILKDQEIKAEQKKKWETRLLETEQKKKNISKNKQK